MEKVSVPKGRAYRLIYPRLVVLVSCIDPETGRPNVITIAWSVPLSINPPMVGISVAPSRYSHELISRSREFVINIPTLEILDKVVKCGKASGRQHDKFREFGLTPAPARVLKTPVIDECVAHLECRVVDQITTGDHTLFVGEVVAASAGSQAFDGNLINIENVRGVYQVGGDTYSTLGKERVEVKPRS
jgi:flavin reductase (DIM6/NTAB) family NADH-FMN oxidoreductase RutF